MGYLALDLSKTSTGWAAWREGWQKPLYGHWVLGSEYTSRGGVFCKLHAKMLELRDSVCRFDYVFAEEPINPAQLQGGTTINTLRLAGGLSAHVESFVESQIGASHRYLREYNVSSWRTDFIGRIENSAAKAKARQAKKAGDLKASARSDLKALTMARCIQLGLSPRKDDEADALGILTYGLLCSGVTPPWLANETLRAPLGAA